MVESITPKTIVAGFHPSDESLSVGGIVEGTVTDVCGKEVLVVNASCVVFNISVNLMYVSFSSWARHVNCKRRSDAFKNKIVMSPTKLILFYIRLTRYCIHNADPGNQ